MFDKIYEIAEHSESFEVLRHCITDARYNNQIDARRLIDGCWCTVAAQLAKEGKIEKVDWMRSLGANINNIAEAYAQSGNVEQVEVYLKEHYASIDSVACGYINASNHQEVKKCIDEHGASVDQVAFNYARRADHQQVENLLNKDLNKDHEIFDAIAAGYALGRDYDKVMFYFENHGASPDEIACSYAAIGEHSQVDMFVKQHGAKVGYVIKGYAFGGYDDKVADLINSAENRKDMALDAVEGYAIAGNHDRICTLFNSYELGATWIAEHYAHAYYFDKSDHYIQAYDGDADFIASIYAKLGNHKKVKEYINSKQKEIQDHISDIANIQEAYIVHGHINEADLCRTQTVQLLDSAKAQILGSNVDSNDEEADLCRTPAKAAKQVLIELLGSYQQKRAAVIDSSGKTKQYFHGVFFSAFQKSFSQKKSAVDDLISALEGNNVDLSKHLPILRNGNLGKILRAFVKSGAGNALVFGKEVNTVSDFIRALGEGPKESQEIMTL